MPINIGVIFKLKVNIGGLWGTCYKVADNYYILAANGSENFAQRSSRVSTDQRTSLKQCWTLEKSGHVSRHISITNHYLRWIIGSFAISKIFTRCSLHPLLLQTYCSSMCGVLYDRFVIVNCCAENYFYHILSQTVFRDYNILRVSACNTDVTSGTNVHFLAFVQQKISVEISKFNQLPIFILLVELQRHRINGNARRIEMQPPSRGWNCFAEIRKTIILHSWNRKRRQIPWSIVEKLNFYQEARRFPVIAIDALRTLQLDLAVQTRDI